LTSLKKKAIPKKEIKLINTLINHHFCIKGSATKEILSVLNTSFSEEFLFDSTFASGFLFEETQKRFLLFDKINEWNYLIWNVWDFEETKKQALFISEKLNTQVYYFFIDPYICTLRWVLADKGKLIRSYYESHNNVLDDEGSFEIEDQIRTELKKQDGKEFWEDKFWLLYEKMCPPIEVMNSYESIAAIKGELI
jgi:hypothetical protein